MAPRKWATIFNMADVHGDDQDAEARAPASDASDEAVEGGTVPPYLREATRELPEFVRAKLEAALPDVIKRTFSAGMGAMFASEDGLRKIAKEMNIADIPSFISSTTNTTKDKVMEIVAREVRVALASMNLAEEIAKILTTLSLEVRTEIRFIPNEARTAKVEPEVKSTVRVRPSARERGVAVAKRLWARRKGESVTVGRAASEAAAGNPAASASSASEAPPPTRRRIGVTLPPDDEPEPT